MAGSAILARSRGTLVHIELTVGSLETGRTVTRVPTDQVLTTRAIATRLRRALVNIHLTVTSVESRPTLASVRIANVFANAVVATQFRHADSFKRHIHTRNFHQFMATKLVNEIYRDFSDRFTAD